MKEPLQELTWKYQVQVRLCGVYSWSGGAQAEHRWSTGGAQAEHRRTPPVLIISSGLVVMVTHFSHFRVCC